MQPTMPEGWYTDPVEPAFLRFWNGATWSKHRKPRPGLPAAYQQQRSRGIYERSRRIG